MIRAIDVLAAIRDTIKNKYSCPVYLDEVTENFKTPCFFLQMRTTAAPAGPKQILHTCTAYVTYFPEKKERARTLYEVKDTLVRLFWNGIAVGDRYIKFDAVHVETEGADADIVYVDLPFRYYEAIDTDDPPYTMQVIHTKYTGGATGVTTEKKRNMAVCHVTPTDETQVISPMDGYDGFTSCIVDPIPADRPRVSRDGASLLIR